MPQQLCPVIIGREAERNALRTALRAAMGGGGGCVVLVGEPGIGKSRLARDVADEAAGQAARVVTGRAVPAAASAAYRPLAEALLQLLRRRALPDDAALASWLPALQPMLPTLIPAHSATVEVPASVRAEAIVQLISRVSAGGLVIVLEDLHWADPDTVLVLECLADSLRDERVLVVMTLRDNPSPALEVAERLRRQPGVTYLALDRLGEDDLATMVRACDPTAPDDVVRRVQSTADGIPLLVEELLASPGMPDSFAATVRARLGEMGERESEVIEGAAVLGRHFNWTLLPATVGQSETDVTRALEHGVESLLLTSDGATVRFRHALTRDAVLFTLIAPRQRQLADAALAALLEAHPTLDGESRDVAIDLALRADDRQRAGSLLADAGSEALAWGALATAADALHRAAGLLAGTPDQGRIELELLTALALAGRVEEVAAIGGRLVTRLAPDPSTVGVRIEAHLRLAQAAVAASRRQMARHHLDEASRLAGDEPTGAVAARIAVLEADVAMGDGDHDAAGAGAQRVLGMEGAPPEVRCHALEIVGRIHRSTNLTAARAAFERALVTAETAHLPLWRLRALHELGTIDLFHHTGVDRLLQARDAADEMGALSTAAILDLELCAAFHSRWDTDACDAHARSAIAMAESLGLHQVRAMAFLMMVGSASMRGDAAATERYRALAVAAAPEDHVIDGLAWAMAGMAHLLAGDAEASMEPYARGMAILGRLPHAEPAAVRALWPVLLAARGDGRAQRAIGEAHRLGVDAFHLNRGLIGYAEAILGGRRGEREPAQTAVADADPWFVNCAGWADLARLLAAPAALAGGWGDPTRWLSDARAGFLERQLPALAAKCEELRRDASPNPWASAGVSAREADVLRLVGKGRSNKDIAEALHLSPRTVEKHVESLLRKTGARSRTELVRLTFPATT